MDDLKKLIREVPDYPKPGILFYDLTTLLKDKQGFRTLIDRLCDHYKGHTIDLVAGMEARGFIFAPALAYRLNAGFVPVRKPKKLPAKTVSMTYALEYGTDSLEIHEDAIQPGQRVLIHGGAGGVGNYAVQLARHRGAFVITTVSTAQVETTRLLGADLVIDHTTTAFEDIAGKVDLVFDTVGGERLERSLAVWTAGGRLVSIATKPSHDEAASLGITALYFIVEPKDGKKL